MKPKRKKNRYAFKEKKINRAALSYEDVPLEDYEEREAPKLTLSGIKRFVKILVILLLCGLGVLIAVNWQKISVEKAVDWIQGEIFGTGVGDGYPANISGTSVSYENFILMGNGPVTASDTSISVLNESAKELLNKQHSYSTPAIRASKKRAILYNIGGTGYSIYSKTGVLAEKNADNKLINADINSEGTYAMLTQSSGYFSRLMVYTEYNEERYKYSFADYYANLISLSESNKTAAVAGFGAVNGGLSSVLYIIDFSSEKPYKTYEFSEEFILAVEYLENGNVAVVGDTAAYVVNPETDAIERYGYNNLTLTTYCINKSSGIVLSLSTSGDGNSCTVVPINAEGKTGKKTETQHKIVSVSNFGDKLVFLANGTAYYYDNQGTLLGAFSAGNDACKILLYDDAAAYVMGINEIRQIRLE